MAYVTGQASSLYDIMNVADNTLQTVGWKPHDRELDADGRLIRGTWEGSGDGNDKLYIQIILDTNSNTKLLLDSSAGYDELLEYWEQPGSIHQKMQAYDSTHIITQPAFTTTYNEKFFYWIFADSYRLIIVCRMSIVYESAYIGFIYPVSSERQYPYPMYVAGNTSSTGNSWPSNTQSMIYPNNNSGFLRRADGTWRAFVVDVNSPSATSTGTIFPYNAQNKRLISNYKEDDSVNQDDFLLIPVMLCTNDPIDVNGMLRGVYWISGTRDLDAERILVLNNEQYIVFDTKQMRSPNSYFAVKME